MASSGDTFAIAPGLAAGQHCLMAGVYIVAVGPRESVTTAAPRDRLMED